MSRINAYAYLRQQIQIQPGTSISFNEIVLVEPSTEGVSFGNDSFFDYVAVEASKDQGQTWVPIINGWDSSAHTEWKTAYDANIDSDHVSTAIGEPSMFRQRIIQFDQSTDFIAGEIVMIRLRLLSDPNAIGWGWTIDDLVIGVQ